MQCSNFPPQVVSYSLCLDLFYREHDKDPDSFFSVMYQLKDSGETFHLSVIGETFADVPSKFLIEQTINSFLNYYSPLFQIKIIRLMEEYIGLFEFLSKIDFYIYYINK